MATDYDAPRNKDEDHETESLQALQVQRGGAQTAHIDVEDSDTAEGMDLTSPMRNWLFRSFRHRTTSSLVHPASWSATAAR